MLLDYYSMVQSQVVAAQSPWTECSNAFVAWTELDSPLGELVETGDYIMMGGAVIPVYEPAETWVEREADNATWTELEASN